MITEINVDPKGYGLVLYFQQWLWNGKKIRHSIPDLIKEEALFHSNWVKTHPSEYKEWNHA